MNLLERIKFNMLFDMKRTLHFFYENGGFTAARCDGKPAWVAAENRMTSREIIYCFNEFLRASGNEKLPGVVSDHATAKICADFYAQKNETVIDKKTVAVFFSEAPVAACHEAVPPLANETALIEKWTADFYTSALRIELAQEEKTRIAQGLVACKRFYMLAVKNGVSKYSAMGLINEPALKICRLNLIYTPYRGKGYGRHITAHLINTVCENGCIPMLYVYGYNSAALRAYRSMGLAEAGFLTEINFL
ncbi:MAG: GNAT family N-acetyltransferase [Defluviitaleaceae bacterium]|nr:GNAT family N-acetyltransferase [Defluviitaleaceae bacterium]